jgi:hypothetical protein
MMLSVTVNSLVFRGMALKLVVVLAMAQTSLSYGATPVSDSSRPDTVTPIPLNWRHLELHDSGVTGSVTTRIDLRKLSAVDVRSTLIDGPKPMSPRVADTRILELMVSNSIRLLLGTVIETQGRLWFNEDDGLPLQLTRIRQGSNPSRKIYRFGSNRVYRLRRQPANKAETGQSPEHWSKISESFYPLPDPDGECPVFLESSQLLYLLSNPDHAVNERPEELCVFDRKRVYQVRFRILGREKIDIDYLQVAAGQETRVRRTLEALHVALTSRPVEGTQGDMEPFSFLGLKDEIHLLLSDPWRIPLRVRGQVPGFGMIDLELKKLVR